MAKPRAQNRPRYASGRAKAIPESQREQDAMSVALANRIKHAGAESVTFRESDGSEHRIAANDAMWGRQLGIMFARQVISREQREALERYADLRLRALRHKSEQKPTPTSSGNVMAKGGRSLREETPVWDRKEVEHFNDAEAVLTEVMRHYAEPMLTHKELLFRLCVLDMPIAWTIPNVGLIRVAANALARHFKL